MNLPNQKIKIKTLFFILFTTSLLVFFHVKETKAQVAVSKLTVAPSRQELIIDPGETTGINIKFLNQESAPISGILKVVDFIVKDKEGSPIFLDPETAPAIVGTTQIPARFSAASWVTLPYERITIAADNKVGVNAKITAPANAEPGGRYIAIYFEPSTTLPQAGGTPKEAASPVTVRIAGLVYIRVSGPIKEEARLVQFSAPRFSEYGPVPITTEILNLGSYHITPKGTITLTNLLGGRVDEVRLEEVNVFPDVSRILESKVGSKWMFGRYKAELAASFGETGQALTGTVFFWVFPWKVVTALILVAIIIALLTLIFYRRFRKHEEELEEKIEDLEEKLEEKEK